MGAGRKQIKHGRRYQEYLNEDLGNATVEVKCPWCRTMPVTDEDVRLVGLARGMGSYSVVCPKCKGSGPLAKNYQGAIVNWNNIQAGYRL